ncbi:ferritin-like domain-containing protein [Paenibacillus lacisoli]|nr:ferritin-like domain-containing protein [Paenibacillus sp. JX-17]
MPSPYWAYNPGWQHYYNHSRQEQKSYKTLQEALELIKKAVSGEREDELFYDYLISEAPTTEEKEIIETIRNDERKHNRMFRQIYQELTGQTIETPQNVEFEKPKSYYEGIRKALFGELGAVERYRDIRAGLPDRYHRDMVFEILTDELKHANKYNYILNLDARRSGKKK